MQEVDFQEVDTGQDSNISHPCQRNNPYGTKKWGGGRPGPGANLTGAGLQKVKERSWLSPKPQRRTQGQGAHARLTASAWIQSRLLEAMHSDVGEKSKGLGVGLSGTGLGFAEPNWKDRVEISASFQALLLRVLGQESQASLQPGQSHPQYQAGPVGGPPPAQPLQHLQSRLPSSRPTAQMTPTAPIHRCPEVPS